MPQRNRARRQGVLSGYPISREGRSDAQLRSNRADTSSGQGVFIRVMLSRLSGVASSLAVSAVGLAVFLAPNASATSPDANGRIAFTAYHDLGGQCPAGYYLVQAAADEGIFTMDPDGSAASQVSSQHRPLVCESDSVFPDPDYRFDNGPSYSPSGKRFAFTLAAYSDDCNNCDYGDLRLYPSVAVMNVDGTHRQVLREGQDPEFSPSGKKIVFGDKDRIAVMSSRGRHERILTGHGPRGWHEEGYEPSIFPSGARVVYVSRKKVNGRWGVSIATIRLDRSHRRRLTTPTKTSANLNSPDVSLDGKRIVFGRDTGIYGMRSDGTHKHRLADGSDPAFSPNGKRIAFARDNTIFVMRANGSHEHAVIPSPPPFGVADPSQVGLADPSWRPKP
jgi:Tol biopolymer transport system component